MPGASAFLRRKTLSRERQEARAGQNRTRYSRFHPSNFLAHHMARIVTAAVLSDAAHIVDGIIGLKQRAFDLARAGDPDNPSPWAMDNPAA